MTCPFPEIMDGEDLVLKFNFNKDTVLLFNFSISDVNLRVFAKYEILKGCPFDQSTCIKSGDFLFQPVLFPYCYKAGEDIYIHFDLDYIVGLSQFTYYSISITAPPQKDISTFAAGNIMENAVFVKKFRNYKIPLDTRYDSTDIRGIDENSYLQYNYGGALCQGWSVQNSAWFKFVAGNNTAVFNVLQDNCLYHTGVQMIVLENTGCYQYQAVSNCSTVGKDSPFQITANNLTIGKTYYVFLDGYKYLATGATEYCDVTINPASGVLLVDAVSQSSGTGIDTICKGESVKLLATSTSAKLYQWNANSTISSTSIADPVASPVNTTTYYVTVTDEDDNQNLDSVVIYVGQDIHISSVVSQYEYCKSKNGSATVNISGNSKKYLYNWSNGTTYNSSLNTNTISNLTSGKYFITVSDEYGCSDKTTVNVDDYCKVKLSLSASKQSICLNDSVILTATSVAGKAHYKYLWNDGNIDSIRTVKPQSPADYAVTVTDQAGDKDSLKININVITPVKPVMTVLPECCLNDPPLKLTSASPQGGEYKGAGIFEINMFDAMIAGIGNHEIIYVYSTSGCKDSVSGIINVKPLPVAFAGKDTSICSGKCVDLKADGGIAYQWNEGNTQIIHVCPFVSSTYTVSVKGINGCTDSDEVNVDILYIPSPDVPDTTICTYGSATGILRVNNMNKEYIYNWYTSLTDSIILHTGNIYNTGVIDKNVIVFVESINPQECRSTIRTRAEIKIFPPPTANFNYQPIDFTERVPVLFYDSSFSQDAKIRSWLWNFGKDKGNSTYQYPTHIFYQSGKDSVTLNILDEHGCKDTLTKSIYIKPWVDIWVPACFSPNGDGVNDFLFVRGPIKKMKFEIFNQWGLNVFETSDKTEGWDGRSKNKIQPEGNYVWHLQVTKEDGKEETKTGEVLLVR